MDARRLVRRLLSALRSSEHRSLMTLQGEIRQLRAQATRHKADRRLARERLSRAESRLTEVEHAHDEARARARRLRAVAVDAEHLRSVLPLRVGALREAPDQAALAREHQFAEQSDAYATVKLAWLAGERPEGTRQISSAGLRLSLPAEGEQDSLAGRLTRGWLPLDDIAAVRSCAVGGVMLDVGANVGSTCIPRVALGDFDCAYAAEPDAANYACLVGNVLDNGLVGRVLPERVAIANWSGDACLEHARHIGSHRLVAAAEADQPGLSTVPCLTLDRWLERLPVLPSAITFVKIDTQGWDVEVLKGATTLLRHKHVVWQMELTRMLKRSGSTLEELAALLRSHFTHARPLGSQYSGIHPIGEVLSRIQDLFEENAFANLLLMNRA